MLRRLLFAAFAIAISCNTAFAQGVGLQCNDPSGFVKTFGPFITGDVMTLGPDCQHAQSGGPAGMAFQNGVVVIGTTPAYAWGGAFNFLQIGSDLGLLASTSGGGAAEFESNVFFDGANYRYMTTGAASKIGFGSGNFGVATAPSGTAGTIATLTTWFFQNNLGNIGIGANNLSPQRALDVNGVVGWRNGTAISLANGLSQNIPLPTSSRVRITGPTGAFSIGGFQSPSDGAILHIYNTTSQQMTIVNEDISSALANRIKTLTGANVVLRTGPSFATFSYDITDTRWILESTN